MLPFVTSVPVRYVQQQANWNIKDRELSSHLLCDCRTVICTLTVLQCCSICVCPFLYQNAWVETTTWNHIAHGRGWQCYKLWTLMRVSINCIVTCCIKNKGCPSGQARRISKINKPETNKQNDSWVLCVIYYCIQSAVCHVIHCDIICVFIAP